MDALDSKAHVDRACAAHGALVLEYYRSAPIEARVSIRYQPATSLFLEERRDISDKEEKMMRGLAERGNEGSVTMGSTSDRVNEVDDHGDVDNDVRGFGRSFFEKRDVWLAGCCSTCT